MSTPATIAAMDALLAFPALVVVKATILFLAAWWVTLLLRRRSAALRHLVWALGIGGAVALPAVMALNPVAIPLLPTREASQSGDEGGPVPPVVSGPEFPATDPATSVTPHDEPAVELNGVSSPVGAPAASRRAFPGTGRVLLFVWLAGALALLIRFARGMRDVAGVVRRAVPLGDAERMTLTAGAVANGGAPDIRVSDEVEMPFAFGLVSPVVVLPASHRQWAAERREAVLLHELAHLSRGDLLMNAVSHVGRALYWFHPLAWHAAHRLRIESERACDDAVLRRGTRASDYADHLLSIATGSATPLPVAALAMARPSAFEGRLLAILEPGLERAAPSRLRVALTTAAFLIVIVPLAAASPTARAGAMSVAQDPAAEAPTRETRDGSAAVPALIEALADANAAVRLAAVSSLGSLEDPRAIAALGKALREDSDPRVREAAAESLGDIDDPRAVPHLVAALRAERVTAVREAIVHALNEIDDPSAAPAVAEATKDPSPAVRRAAVSALSEFEVPSTLPAIAALVRDEDVEVRRHVADALGNMADASSLEALTTLARDADAEVRSNAINALGNLEDRRTLGTLVAALKDANADVRSQAADAIQNIPDLRQAPEGLIAALADSDKNVRHNVAHALGEIGDDAAVPALKRALGDNNADVRRAVAESLAEIGGPEAITALMGLLKDQDPEIRRIAAEALGKRR